MILLLLAALRFGVWQGPVGFSPAEVMLLLTAPIAVGCLVRPRLDQAFAVGVVVGVLVAVVVLLLLSGGVPGAGAARSAGAVGGLAALGLLAVGSSWLVQASRTAARLVLRATPVILLLAATLLAAADNGGLGASLALWSGPWGWAIAPLVGGHGWPIALGLMLVLTGVAVGLARRQAGAASVESFLTRAQTRDRMTVAAITLDYRFATLTRRRALARGPRALPRVPRPARPQLVVVWRDALGLLRDRSRVLWAALFGAVGMWEVLSHPGRSTPAVAAAIALYFAASVLCEPLREDVDDPDKSLLLLSRSYGRVIAAHCVLPAMILFAIAAITTVTTTTAGTLAIGGLVLIPVLAPLVAGSVLCAALAARRGGRITETVLGRAFATDLSNPIGWLLLAFWLAPWLFINILIAGGPALLLGGAIAHHHGIVASGVIAFVLSTASVIALVAHARRSRPT